METLGKRISRMRRLKGFTQEAMAEKLAVSPQAVSKWENDISCPDIQILPQIAKLLDTTVDELLTGETQEVTVVPTATRKPINELIFRIKVNSSDGDKVKVNLPLPLVKVCLEMGMNFTGNIGNDTLKDIDFSQLIALCEQGVIGKIVEVESADGDTVEIVVE